MATHNTIRDQLRLILAAYPQHTSKLSDQEKVDMLRVWIEDLTDIDDALLIAACRNYRERSQWLPSISEIRNSAVSLMRQASPARQTASEAWGDVRQAISRIGSYGSPQFDNPATAAVVRRMGWRDICMDEGPSAVLRAQFERMYDAEIERLENKVRQSPQTRAFIAGADSALLSEPDNNSRFNAIVAQIANSKYVS